MKHSKSYERDWGLFEGRNDSAVSGYETMIQNIQSKIDEGHKIEWSPNERWCEIDGETFNIRKDLFDKLVHNGDIVLSITTFLNKH